MGFSRKKNILFVFILGAIIFVIFSSGIGYDKLIYILSNINKPLYFLVFLFNFINLFLFAITWKFLAPIKISVYKLFLYYMAGTFINNITPSFGTAGEPVKAILLSKNTSISKSECFASVVSQRMLNMFPFLTIGIIGVFVIFTSPEIKLSVYEITALLFSTGMSFLAFGLIIYFYVKKDRFSEYIESMILFLAPYIGLIKKGFNQKEYSESVKKSINSFHGGLKDIRKNKHGLVKATFFSYLGWFFDILAIYTVFVSIGVKEINIGVIIVAYTLSMISGWLPLFLPGGLGIVDGTMAGLFFLGGIPLEISMVATMLYRLASYWFNTIFGAFSLWLSLRDKN